MQSKITNSIKLITDYKFDYQNGKQVNSYLKIETSNLKSLLSVLSASEFIVHLAILSEWKNDNGLPSPHELSEITNMNISEVTKAVHNLMTLKINDVDFYNKERLKTKNKQNYDIYHV